MILTSIYVYRCSFLLRLLEMLMLSYARLLAVRYSLLYNGFFLVQVKDSGSGINPQDIPKLFTKFAHNQSLATRNSGGSGLGLAICKRYSWSLVIHLFRSHHKFSMFLYLFYTIACIFRYRVRWTQELLIKPWGTVLRSTFMDGCSGL